MRKFLKSAGLPIGVIVLAMGSAFATNAIKNANLLSEPGYQQLDSEGFTCVERTECSEFGSKVCTWNDPATNIDHNLYRMETKDGQTACVKQLYRID
ncbi:DUF6520 family protein [Flavobacterium sp. HSC-61S13]|uniref:DUF6520 family protein n=1 Tax=Flavobacterium sp. HSC-61S13 TaxID=2910963 RepID=UPI00209F920B|nr:DUF6520 family protein [Flavobacterium sp. HSC-61S13]MCP1994350.1 hypothetical protein [Flavobacterium sp. HSC-61S13]